MTQRPHYSRRACSVQGCKRTSARFPGSWICGPHYRLAYPPHSPERRAWLRVKRQFRKHEDERDWQRVNRLWRLALKRAARRETEGFIDVRQLAEILG